MPTTRHVKKDPEPETVGAITVDSVYFTDPDSGDVTVYERGSVPSPEHAKLLGKHVFAAPDAD